MRSRPARFRCRRPERAQRRRRSRAALDAIAAYAPRAMRDQGTPGLSVAITDRTRNAAHHHAGLRERRRASPGHAADALPDRIDHEVDDRARAARAARRGPNRLERTGAAISSVVFDRLRRDADPRSPAALAHGGTARRLRRRDRLRVRHRRAARGEDALRARARRGRTPTTATRRRRDRRASRRTLVGRRAAATRPAADRHDAQRAASLRRTAWRTRRSAISSATTTGRRRCDPPLVASPPMDFVDPAGLGALDAGGHGRATCASISTAAGRASGTQLIAPRDLRGDDVARHARRTESRPARRAS